MFLKIQFILLLSAAYLFVSGQTNSSKAFINPTGSYKLDNKPIVKDGETYGYFGDISVKLLKHTKIAISFSFVREHQAITQAPLSTL